MKTPKKQKPAVEKKNTSEENKTPGFDDKAIRKGMGRKEGEVENSIPDSEDIDTTESDVTADDLQGLGPKDLSLDGGDDEDLIHREHPVDFSGGDLDVPGSELDDANEDIGSEDEENNSYSLGNNN